jgi:hypothetical protein
MWLATASTFGAATAAECVAVIFARIRSRTFTITEWFTLSPLAALVDTTVQIIPGLLGTPKPLDKLIIFGFAHMAFKTVVILGVYCPWHVSRYLRHDSRQKSTSDIFAG